MPRLPIPALLAACGLAAAGCLETEERVVVHADGSLTLTTRVEGHAWDLRDGYPLPCEPGWTPADDASAHWLEAAARDELDAWWPHPGGPASGDDERNTEVALALSRTFASADQIPEISTAPGEPYPEALPRRSTSLLVDRKPDRTIYVFERTFHRCDPLFRVLEDRMEAEADSVPDHLWTKLDEGRPLDDDECALVVDALRRCYVAGGRAVAREALAALSVQGSSALPVGTSRRLAEQVGEAVGDAVLLPEFVERQRRLEAGEDVPIDALADIEARARLLLRQTLAAGLDGAGVAWEPRNATLQQAERLVAAWDRATDLRDESFVVEVVLPGVLLGGNAPDIDDGVARWEFSGDELLDRDVTLRAVSVVE